jgi:hypothetical protein
MSDRDRDFISTIARLRHPPSNKQHEWLVAIYLRLSGEPEGRWR